MSEHGFEVREVPHESPDDGVRLQEPVVGDVAASVSALTGTGAFGYAAAATFHTRRQRDADEARHEAEMAALRTQMDAEMRVLRADMDAEMRVLRAQGFGFGPEDHYGGFGVDDDYYGGFGLE
jgi:hypothetical protein